MLKQGGRRSEPPPAGTGRPANSESASGTRYPASNPPSRAWRRRCAIRGASPGASPPTTGGRARGGHGRSPRGQRRLREPSDHPQRRPENRHSDSRARGRLGVPRPRPARQLLRARPRDPAVGQARRLRQTLPGRQQGPQEPAHLLVQLPDEVEGPLRGAPRVLHRPKERSKLSCETGAVFRAGLSAKDIEDHQRLETGSLASTRSRAPPSSWKTLQTPCLTKP